MPFPFVHFLGGLLFFSLPRTLGVAPLNLAARAGNAGAVGALLAAGASRDGGDVLGHTAASHAATAAVLALLRGDAEPEFIELALPASPLAGRSQSQRARDDDAQLWDFLQQMSEPPTAIQPDLDDVAAEASAGPALEAIDTSPTAASAHDKAGLFAEARAPGAAQSRERDIGPGPQGVVPDRADNSNVPFALRRTSSLLGDLDTDEWSREGDAKANGPASSGFAVGSSKEVPGTAPAGEPPEEHARPPAADSLAAGGSAQPRQQRQYWDSLTWDSLAPADHERLRRVAGLFRESGHVNDRWHHLVLYRASFVAREFVEWAHESGHAQDREHATLLGTQMTAGNIVHHVVDQHAFSDSFLFFRFRADDTANDGELGAGLAERAGSGPLEVESSTYLKVKGALIAEFGTAVFSRNKTRVQEFLKVEAGIPVSTSDSPLRIARRAPVSWKRYAGRTGGSESYHFGDLASGLFGAIAAKITTGRSRSYKTNLPRGHATPGPATDAGPDAVITAFGLVPEDEVNRLAKVGEGASSTVYKALWRGKLIAEKMLEIIDVEDSRARMMTEIEILSTVEHPHIVAFVGAFCSDDQLCIFSEFAEHGNLYDQLHGDATISGDVMRRWSLEIGGAIAFIHGFGTHSIVHRDIKSPNVLLFSRDGELVTKICDFGVAHLSNISQSFDVEPDGGTLAHTPTSPCTGSLSFHRSLYVCHPPPNFQTFCPPQPFVFHDAL